ncbi:Na+/H+ antiporter subunit E [Alteromonas sp. ASW11-130]|uniref:Na+/H+ antiporter subunit E n=1 Tax=Alteromonas sp. ASW11-130 TaxID=3015775 RepID=UPI002242B228|nr:Na+/H+ antiporter subunit E [Alteromonas sp. ASW11-130]MCW8092755.1 Na+/H+ antiporter subunit E [Alteromonas sp. ASW11-130]
MMHYFSLASLLMILWLLLSGHYNPLMIGFGVVSVLITLLLSHRMRVIDEESHPVHLTGDLFKYWAVLVYKIFQANIDVVLRIIGVRPIEPQLIRIPFPQQDDLSKVIYANSITLTPGSASIEIYPDSVLVHTISKEGAQALIEGELADIFPIQQDEHNGKQS